MSNGLSSGYLIKLTEHLKEQQRKELRQQVRALVFQIGLKKWKDIPNKVNE